MQGEGLPLSQYRHSKIGIFPFCSVVYPMKCELFTSASNTSFDVSISLSRLIVVISELKTFGGGEDGHLFHLLIISAEFDMRIWIELASHSHFGKKKRTCSTILERRMKMNAAFVIQI